MESQNDIDKESFPIQAYTLKELAHKYRCSVQTFRKWLVNLKPRIGPRIGHFYNPRQVKIIVDHLGKPFIWLAAVAMRILAMEVVDDDHDHEMPRDDRPLSR